MDLPLFVIKLSHQSGWTYLSLSTYLNFLSLFSVAVTWWPIDRFKKCNLYSQKPLTNIQLCFGRENSILNIPFGGRRRIYTSKCNTPHVVRKYLNCSVRAVFYLLSITDRTAVKTFKVLSGKLRFIWIRNRAMPTLHRHMSLISLLGLLQAILLPFLHRFK